MVELPLFFFLLFVCVLIWHVKEIRSLKPRTSGLADYIVGMSTVSANVGFFSRVNEEKWKSSREYLPGRDAYLGLVPPLCTWSARCQIAEGQFCIAAIVFSALTSLNIRTRAFCRRMRPQISLERACSPTPHFIFGNLDGEHQQALCTTP